MLHADIPDYVVVNFIFLVAGIVKGILGLGLPTVAMGLLGLMLPMAQAASLLTFPSLATNSVQMVQGPFLLVLAKRLWPMLVALVAGIFAGHDFMDGPPRLSRFLLGAALVAYALLALAGMRLPKPAAQKERLCSVMVGFTTGLLTAATGVFVLPAVPYLQSLDLSRQQLSQAMGMAFTVSTLALAVNLAGGELIGSREWLGSLLMLLPAIVGMWLGRKIQDELGETTYRRAFFAGVLILGLSLFL